MSENDNRVVRVLDHGHVRLIESMGNDLSIVRNARVSYDAEWRAGGSDKNDAKLINYLWKNKHTSPFEAVTFTFDIKCPMFVARQWHRHRTWCLAGETELWFSHPNGKIFKKKIKEIVDSWNVENVEVKRPDKQTRSLRDFRREQISSMSLRYRKSDGTFGLTNITNAWCSGVRSVYSLTLQRGESFRTIRATSDHPILTTEGWKELGSLSEGDIVFGQGRVPLREKVFEENPTELEEWRQFQEGYEVSNLGKIRSYFRRGSDKKSETPVLKAIIVSKSGRAVVSICNKPLQVSRIVAETFLGKIPEGSFVLHNNDDPLDNRASNLRFGTAKDNRDDHTLNSGGMVNGFITYSVISLKEEGEEPVYDITVNCEEHNFVANGIVVHNCYNEVSARYTELPEQFYVPDDAVLTAQSTSNKQMRTTELLPPEIREKIRGAIRAQNETAFDLYRALLESGCPRELARSVLPVGTYTHYFGTVNLRNLFHFLDLRLHEHAQYEIRVYAEAMLKLIEPIVPVAVEAYKRASQTS